MSPINLLGPALLIGTAGLLAISLARWARTPEDHPDHDARGAAVRLATIVLAAEVVEAIRERFEYGLLGYWICSALLLAIAAFAVPITAGLLRAYRRGDPGR